MLSSSPTTGVRQPGEFDRNIGNHQWEFALALRQWAERTGNIDQHQGKVWAVEPSDPTAKGDASQHEPYANDHPI